MYKSILIPLENTSVDRTILDHIQPLARMTGARIVLIHVADGYVARNQDQLNLEDSEEMKVDRKYLADCERELTGAGFQVTAHLRQGEPAEQILRLASEQSCDLIAMATHGHGFIKDTLLGSVANQVRHKTSIPILMVRGPAQISR